MNVLAAIELSQLRAQDDNTVAKMQVHGLPVHIEAPKHTIRHLKDENGKTVYKRFMHNSYGYIANTKGRDGDSVDVFVGPLGDKAKECYVIHMLDKGDPGNDEDKCFLGFSSSNEAKQAFLLHYPSSYFGGMTTLPVDEFKKKLASASLPYHRKKITAAQIKCPKCGSTNLSGRLSQIYQIFGMKKCLACGELVRSDG